MDDAAVTTNTTFPVARRGYDPAQVERYLARAEAQLRRLHLDRAAAVAAAGAQSAALDEVHLRAERLHAAVRAVERLLTGSGTSTDPGPARARIIAGRIVAALYLAHDRTVEIDRAAAAAAAHRISDALAAAANPPSAVPDADPVVVAAVVDDAEVAQEVRAAEAEFAAEMDRRRIAAIDALAAETAARRAEAREVIGTARTDADRALTAARASADAILLDAARLAAALERRNAAAILALSAAHRDLVAAEADLGADAAS